MTAVYLAWIGYGLEDPTTIALSLAASLLAGRLLYRLVETPCMTLRTRLVQANRRAPPPPLGNPL
jgi:peptidoglycan/LPS O-acetylase OafA/YrhL